MPKANDGLICDDMSEKIIDTVNKIVISEGTGNINVRRILNILGITNRVFYNRFHNIDEVLDIITHKSIMKIRETIIETYDRNRDFFEQVTEMLEKTLLLTYNVRMKLVYRVFDGEAYANSNFEWWIKEIKDILNYAIENKHIKPVDTDMTSYAIWCFIRGFNTDVIGRKIPVEEALERYKYGFKFFLDGLKY